MSEWARRGWKVFVAGLGVAAVVGGVVALLADADTEKYVALLVLGVVLLLLAPNVHRLTGITASKDGIAATFGVSEEAASVIKRLGLVDEMQTYTFIHNNLTDPADQAVKIRLQDALVDQARAHAFSHNIKKSDVDTLFSESQPAARVLGVGLALSNATLASDDLYRASIGQSTSANEQYQGLRLAEQNWSSLDPELQAELVDTIRTSPWIAGDSDREEPAERILAKWSAQADERPTGDRAEDRSADDCDGDSDRPADGSDDSAGD